MAQRKVPSVDDLTGVDGLAILRRLWKKGGTLREAIRLEIEAYLAEVVPEDVADAVFADLDGIEVEDLWNRSGSQAGGGYSHPADETWEMVEEALAPFVGELERYLRLGMGEEAMLYCVGLLQGIYLFGTESKTAFREWAPDDPREAFSWILRKWKKTPQETRFRERMSEELRARCPDWAGEIL